MKRISKRKMKMYEEELLMIYNTEENDRRFKNVRMIASYYGFEVFRDGGNYYIVTLDNAEHFDKGEISKYFTLSLEDVEEMFDDYEEKNACLFD